MPKFYGVFIGINEYEKPHISNLKFAVNDAIELAKAFEERVKIEKDITVLTSPKQSGKHKRATKKEILDTITYITELGEPDDFFVLFFSGHGIQMGNEIYLLGEDSDNRHRVLLKNTGIPLDDIVELVKMSKIRQVMMLLDSCRSEASSFAKTGTSPMSIKDVLAVSKDMAIGERLVGIITSTDEGKYSYELPEYKHGLFTYSLMEVLKREDVEDFDSLYKRVYEFMKSLIEAELRHKSVIQLPAKRLEGTGKKLILPFGKRIPPPPEKPGLVEGKVIGLKISNNGEIWLANVEKDGNNYIFVSSTNKEIGPFDRIGYIAISHNGEIWVVEIDQGSRRYIMSSEGEKFGPFDDIRYPILISHEGDIWVSGVKEGEKWRIITSKGGKFGPFDYIWYIGNPKFEKKWLAEVEKGNERYIISPFGKEFGPFKYDPFDYINLWDSLKPFLHNANSIKVSSVGEKWILKVVKDKNESGVLFNSFPYATLPSGKQWFIISSTGEEFGPFDWIGPMAISSTGEIWVAEIDQGSRRYIMSSEGEKFGPFDNVHFIKMSYNGKTWLAIVWIRSAWYIVTSEYREFGPFNDVSSSSIKISGDGRVWLAGVKKEEKWYIITSREEKFGPFDEIEPIIESFGISYYGTVWVAKIRKANKHYIYTSKGDYLGPLSDTAYDFHPKEDHILVGYAIPAGENHSKIIIEKVY